MSEYAIPRFLAAALDAALVKGAGHKYIRRVPTGNLKRPWKYYYTVAGGRGLGHREEFEEGAKFAVKHAGKDGHFEVVGKTDDGKLRIKHDESSHEATLDPAALSEMLRKEHVEKLEAHAERVKRDLADAAKHGSEKQKAAVRARASKYEHTRELLEEAKEAHKAAHPEPKPDPHMAESHERRSRHHRMDADFAARRGGLVLSALHKRAGDLHAEAELAHRAGAPNARMLGEGANVASEKALGASQRVDVDVAAIHEKAQARHETLRLQGERSDLHKKAAELHRRAALALRNGDEDATQVSADANAATSTSMGAPGDPVQIRTEAALTPKGGRIAGSWPSLPFGQLVDVHDGSGWIWRARAEGGDSLVLQGERKATSLPPVGSDNTIRLPDLHGHAHARYWERGDIVEVHGQHYKVAKEPKLIRHQGKREYALAPATAEQWASRPGRMRVDTRSAAERAVGSAIQTPSGEWLHVKGVDSSSFHGAAGKGTTWRVEGRHVPADKARKINDVHGPTLSGALDTARAQRTSEPLPDDATVLIPKNPSSLASTGERVAVVDDGDAVLHERVGDPDQSDSWGHYVVKIRDPELVGRAKRFIRAQRSAR